MRSTIPCLVVLLAAAAPHAGLAANKCTGLNGEVIYSDKACPPAPGLARLDPVPTRSAPKGNGVLTPAERKAIVDQMNAEIPAAIARQARQEAEATKIRNREDAARPRTTTVGQDMGFDDCRKLVAGALIGVAGYTRTIVLMDNQAVTMHRVCLADGSLLLTCSAADRRFVRTTSPPDGRGC